MPSRAVPTLLASVSVLVVALTGTAAAASSSGSPSDSVKSLSAQIEEQRAALDKQARALDVQKHRIDEQKRRLDRLEAQLKAETTPRVQPAVARSESSDATARPSRMYVIPNGYRTAAADETAQRNPQQGPASEPKNSEKAPEVHALSEAGGVLLNQGQLVIEPSVQYARVDNSTAEVTGFTVLPGIVVGNILIAQAHRDTVVSSVDARYGVTNRLEFEVKVPYVYRSDTTTTRPLGTSSTSDTTMTATGAGLGDIEFAGHYQINKGTDGWPFFVANLRVKTTTGRDPFSVPRDAQGNELELETGNGFWGVEPSLTMIYPSDPAVLFANLNYFYNFGRNVGGQFGTIDPGNTIGATVGMGVALNEKLSFSLAYDHKRVGASYQNGALITGSRVLELGTLDIGAFYRLSNRVGLNFTVAAGVTRDAPDAQLTVRVPITF